ncbi:MAG: acetolactate synthase large subunit [Actinomycetota bacterium]|nr:acetolactate synthase large subunit [Actinomycetota bacterium]
MIGARALLETLLAGGVDTCFMNPGTSEMHFVAALDDVPAMRSVLALFEGVATGAADGYGRMTGRAAATLVHLGPGLGNGLANLHNARRARTPVVNVVGDHATYHQGYDAPLQSDIDTSAANVSSAIIRPADRAALAGDAARAVALATGPPGGVATLIVPADISWSDGPGPAGQAPSAGSLPVDAAAVTAAAQALRSGGRTGFLVGGDGTRRQPLMVLGDVAQQFGAATICETFPARLERGAGIPPLTPLPYLGEMAADVLDGLTHLILVGARSPVSFFAYPGRPSDLVPAGCTVHQLSEPGQPALGALQALAAELDVAPGTWKATDAERPPPPSGSDALSAEAINRAVGALMPEGAIISDESATSGFRARGSTAGAPPHDWLTLTGGAIGQGLPVAVGAAVASPDRRVIALQADGGSLYTIQALWTMAREGLDVVTVIYNNRSYAILNMELDRVGAAAGDLRARAMLDLSRPDIDFVSIAAGLGVAATRATTAGELTDRLATALATPGPSLIDAII